MSDKGSWWEVSKWEVHSCIWCNADIEVGDEMLSFMNPCCEMGGLSICKECALQVHSDHIDFKRGK